MTNSNHLRRLTCDQSRQIDQQAIHQYGLSGLVLMENAGAAAAQWLHAHYRPGRVCILCGKGNNAGDGYVIARHLQSLACYWPPLGDSGSAATPTAATATPAWTVQVVSIVPMDDLSGDAAVNGRIARAAAIPIVQAREANELEAAIGKPDLLVDCLLGTGTSGAPRGLYADAIRIANGLPATRIAIDVPSGLDADSGEPADPTLIAAVTLTMVTGKVGFASPAAAPFVGQVVRLPIGLPWAMHLPLLRGTPQ